MVAGAWPPVASQETETVTLPPGETVLGLTSAAGSARAAEAAKPSVALARAATDRTRAVERMGRAPSTGGFSGAR